MARQVRILQLEDNPADAELVRLELCRTNFDFNFRRVQTKEAFLKELKDFNPNIILSDYSLPLFDGMCALTIAKKKCPDVPFIFVTGSLGEEKAIETLKSGATDFVLKDRIARIGPSIQRALAESEERQKCKQLQEQLIHNTLHDALTKLPNRTLFLDRLGQLIKHGSRHKDRLFAVLFLDLDRFKAINDCLGHRTGDQLLIAVARRLEKCLRSSDTVGRMGGDEFTILLDDIKDVSDAIRVSDRVSRELASPFIFDDHRVFTSASIGIALSATGYDRSEDILHDADVAMLRAKRQGGARYEVFDTGMRSKAINLLDLENELLEAIKRRQFEIHYQPIVSLENGLITGLEALLRWRHPDRGLLPPAEFIPLAEDTKLIVPISQWVLKESCRQTRAWQKEFGNHKPLSISVNVSPKQFTESNLVDEVKEIIDDSGLEACNLKLEVMENVIARNAERVNAMLSQLSAFGVKVSIDDFGTGYTSLSHFYSSPINTLKIDRSFISGLHQGERSRDIIQAILMLANNFGMDVTAEGIENSKQLAQLRALQRTSGQGYYFSKPVGAEATRALLAARPSW